MSISPNLGLTIWDLDSDPYDHTQLAINFTTLDAHDHTAGRGKRITTLAIQDLAVTTPKLADNSVTGAKFANGAVTNPKIADDAVDMRAIAPAGVGTNELADRSVTSIKLAEPIRPLGEVIDWWRPTSATPLPDDWVPCDGRQLSPSEHDFAGGGTITLPDLRNKFVLGAAVGGTGTGPTQPPAIGQAGGTNQANLAHTHVVPHSHTGGTHTHPVASHSHTVNAHTHGLPSHSHTVNAHTHPVGGHTHSVVPHNHHMNHTHAVDAHSHGIVEDGYHAHGFAGGHVVASRRSYIYPAYVGGTEDRQTLYLGGFNAGGTSATAWMDAGGVHSHGGGTAYAGASTGLASQGYTDLAGGVTDVNAAFSSGSASPGTSSVGGTTASSSPTTNAVTGVTGPAESTTSIDSPVTTPALAEQDLRPAYVGLLKLIKVKR